jgi:hypothetical protein
MGMRKRIRFEARKQGRNATTEVTRLLPPGRDSEYPVSRCVKLAYETTKRGCAVAVTGLRIRVDFIPTGTGRSLRGRVSVDTSTADGTSDDRDS